MVDASARGMDHYEDFMAWKLAQALNVKVFEMTSRPPGCNDFRFRDNLRDAADSVERNFPEGFGKFAPKEFARFLDHSKGSLMEVRNELQVGLTRGYFAVGEVREADRLARRTLGALTGLQKYLRSARAQRNAEQARRRHLASPRPDR